MSTGILPPPQTYSAAGLQLLGIYSASAGASIDIVSRNIGGLTGPIFQSDFDVYTFDIFNVIPGTNASALQMRVSTNAGVSYDSGANYNHTQWSWRVGGASQSGTETGATAMNVSIGLNSTVANGGLSGNLNFYNPLSSSMHKRVNGICSMFETGSFNDGCAISAAYLSVTPVNACQFLASAGTITGTILVYGKAKSATVGSLALPFGRVVQTVNFQTGAVATGTTIIPMDDTIPQITEGDQYMSLAITPISATNKLKIDVVIQVSPSVAGLNIVALFQDSTASALASMWAISNFAAAGITIAFSHFMTAGTTSPTTFKVRIGLDRAGTLTFNGNASARFLGGSLASSITITELAV